MPVRRSHSTPRRLSSAENSEDDLPNAAFRRSVSSPFSGGAPFVFRAPRDFGGVDFEQEILLEVQRLGDWLKGELQELQGNYSAPVLEPLRLIVASNAKEALLAVRERARPSLVTELGAQVKAAFVEQELLLAAWTKEGKLRAGAPADASGGGLDLVEQGGGYVWRVLMLAGIFLALVHVAHAIPDCSIRCFLLIVSVLTLQLSGVVPQYCVGLLVPVFSTVLRVLPGQTIVETAHLCFGAMMNQMTALVIGSFTINAIFLRCQLEVRFIDAIAGSFGQLPKTFLLMLMLGCMLASAVTFVTLLALSSMLPICLSSKSPGGKGLLLGVGIACTLGGALTPLSGTTSIIVLSTVTEFGIQVDFLTWVLVALPLSTLVCVAAWLTLLLVFGSPPALERDERTHLQRLGLSNYFFLGCALLFIVGCAAEESLKPWIGSSGNLGLMLTALSFGSGFLSKADFAAMPWEVLMILFGVNVTAFTLKESGLALSLATMLIPVQVYSVWLWLEIGKITAVSLLLASVVGQTVVATLAIPVVVALGAKLYCPLLTSLLATLAIHYGVATPHSSTDLILTLEMAGETKHRDARLLSRLDFLAPSFLVSATGWLLVMTVGYYWSMGLLGVPPQSIIIKEPTALIPSVIWLGNETTAAEQVEILKQRMEGESLNETLDQVAKDEALRPLGTGRNENITIGGAQAPSPIVANYSVKSLPRLVAWVHHRHRRHVRRHMLRKRAVAGEGADT